MTEQEIIEAAREAGLYLDGTNTQQPLWVLTTKELQLFTKIIEAKTLERAAMVCDEQADEPECPERAKYCADAIRALKDQS